MPCIAQERAAEPVERVRDPDEAALGADRGDRLGRRDRPARDRLRRNTAIRSPSAVRISSPTITRQAGRLARPRDRAASAPSIRSWSVIARWVSPRAAAARTSDSGEASESNDADVWTWRSTNARSLGDTGARRHGHAQTCGDQRLLEEVEVLERQARCPSATQFSEFSATWHGTPVTWVRSLSMFRSSEPPPDMTMPLSMMSELSSGGVCSRTVPDRGDELLERRLDRLHDLGARDRDRPRQAGDQVAAADLHLELALERQRRPDLDLDLLGRPLADHQVVLLADVRGDLPRRTCCRRPAATSRRRSRRGR